MRGRPQKNFDNNWNDDWYPVLECGANRVLRKLNHSDCRLVDSDELINEAWLTCMRRLPPTAKKGDWRWMYLNSSMRRYVHEYSRKAHVAGVTIKRIADNFDIPDRPQVTYDNVEDVQHVLQNLSDRDHYIVTSLMQGNTQTDIAEELGVTSQCVSFRVGQIRQELSFLTKSKSGECHEY